MERRYGLSRFNPFKGIDTLKVEKQITEFTGIEYLRHVASSVLKYADQRGLENLEKVKDINPIYLVFVADSGSDMVKATVEAAIIHNKFPDPFVIDGFIEVREISVAALLKETFPPVEEVAKRFTAEETKEGINNSIFGEATKAIEEGRPLLLFLSSDSPNLTDFFTLLRRENPVIVPVASTPSRKLWILKNRIKLTFGEHYLRSSLIGNQPLLDSEAKTEFINAIKGSLKELAKRAS